MEEFTYEQIRVKALKQGVKDNKVHIGLWANLNNYLKTRRKKRLRPIILHCRNWLTDKIKIGAERFILSNLGGVLIHFLLHV